MEKERYNDDGGRRLQPLLQARETGQVQNQNLLLQNSHRLKQNTDAFRHFLIRSNNKRNKVDSEGGVNNRQSETPSKDESVDGNKQ